MSILSKAMRISAIVLVMLTLARLAHAQSIANAKNQGGAIQACTGGSTQVLAKDDLTLGLRDYLMIQCTGANNCYCCIGTNNACTTTNGTLLSANGVGFWLLVSVPRANGIIVAAPAGDVSCCGAGGTSNAVTLDY